MPAIMSRNGVADMPSVVRTVSASATATGSDVEAVARDVKSPRSPIHSCWIWNTSSRRASMASSSVAARAEPASRASTPSTVSSSARHHA